MEFHNTRMKNEMSLYNERMEIEKINKETAEIRRKIAQKDLEKIQNQSMYSNSTIFHYTYILLTVSASIDLWRSIKKLGFLGGGQCQIKNTVNQRPISELPTVRWLPKRAF